MNRFDYFRQALENNTRSVGGAISQAEKRDQEAFTWRQSAPFTETEKKVIKFIKSTNTFHSTFKSHDRLCFRVLRGKMVEVDSRVETERRDL